MRIYLNCCEEQIVFVAYWMGLVEPGWQMLDTCGETAVSVQILRGRAVCGGGEYYQSEPVIRDYIDSDWYPALTNYFRQWLVMLLYSFVTFKFMIRPFWITYWFHICLSFINIFVCVKRTRILTLARCDKIIRSSNYSRVSGAGGGLHWPPHLCIGIMVRGCLELWCLRPGARITLTTWSLLSFNSWLIDFSTIMEGHTFSSVGPTDHRIKGS